MIKEGVRAPFFYWSQKELKLWTLVHFALASKKPLGIYDVLPDSARGLIDVNRKSNPTNFRDVHFLSRPFKATFRCF